MTEQGNRILSVSYGSFSVSLEGFEDPFEILRDITEYFRAVLAADPSFGTLAISNADAFLKQLGTEVIQSDVDLSMDAESITVRPVATTELKPEDVLRPQAPAQMRTDVEHPITELESSALRPLELGPELEQPVMEPAQAEAFSTPSDENTVAITSQPTAPLTTEIQTETEDMINTADQALGLPLMIEEVASISTSIEQEETLAHAVGEPVKYRTDLVKTEARFHDAVANHDEMAFVGNSTVPSDAPKGPRKFRIIRNEYTAPLEAQPAETADTESVEPSAPEVGIPEASIEDQKSLRSANPFTRFFDKGETVSVPVQEDDEQEADDFVESFAKADDVRAAFRKLKAEIA